MTVALTWLQLCRPSSIVLHIHHWLWTRIFFSTGYCFFLYREQRPRQELHVRQRCQRWYLVACGRWIFIFFSNLQAQTLFPSRAASSHGEVDLCRPPTLLLAGPTCEACICVTGSTPRDLRDVAHVGWPNVSWLSSILSLAASRPLCLIFCVFCLVTSHWKLLSDIPR